MKKYFSFLLFILPVIVSAQNTSVISGNAPISINNKTGKVIVDTGTSVSALVTNAKNDTAKANLRQQIASVVAAGVNVSDSLTIVNANNYGMKPDGVSVSDGAMTSGLATLTSATAVFTLADVGKYIQVGGAGAGGIEFVGTISAYTNSTTVTLSGNASTTVTGATFRYGTDNTTPLQNALNAASLAAQKYVTVTLQSSSKRYFFSSAPVTTNSINAQVYIPNTNYSPSSGHKTIVIEGVAPSVPFIDFAANQGSANTGVVLESMRMDSGMAVLGSDRSSSVYGTFNWTMVYLKNITIRVKSKSGATDVKPYMTAFDASFLDYVSIDGCKFNTQSTTIASVKPDSGCYGVRMPKFNNGAFCILKNSVIERFFVGIQVAEHSSLYDNVVTTCWKAISGQTTNHAMHGNNNLLEWNANNFEITGLSFGSFTSTRIEHYPTSASTVWFNNQYDLIETNAGLSHILIEYNIVGAGLGPNQTFIRTGSTYNSLIVCKEIGFANTHKLTGGSPNTDEYIVGNGPNATIVTSSGAVASVLRLTVAGSAKFDWRADTPGDGTTDDVDLYDRTNSHSLLYWNASRTYGIGGPDAKTAPAVKISKGSNDFNSNITFAPKIYFGTDSNSTWDPSLRRLQISLKAPRAFTGLTNSKLSVQDSTSALTDAVVWINQDAANARSLLSISNSHASTSFSDLFNYFGVIGTSASGTNYGGFADAGEVFNGISQGSQISRVITGTKENKPYHVLTNNLPRLTIFGGGNVSIGSTTDVAGAFQVTGGFRHAGILTATGTPTVKMQGTDSIEYQMPLSVLSKLLVVSGSFSGVGTATTVFTVTIGTTQANSTYKVNVTPTSVLSAALFYVTNKTTTTFDVTYMAGLTGTVTFDWAVYP